MNNLNSSGHKNSRACQWQHMN